MPNAPPCPQLAKPVDQPPEGDGWLQEPKWDGYPVLAPHPGGLWKREGPLTSRQPVDVQALDALTIDWNGADGAGPIHGAGTAGAKGLFQVDTVSDARFSAVLLVERPGQAVSIYFNANR